MGVDTPEPAQRRFVFRHRHRLHGSASFQAVHQARARKHAGPLTVLARPNGLSESRLGLSVGRRVGNAVKRNRVKRLLRESFRLTRHRWPSGYDWVVVVKPHELLGLSEYQRLMTSAVGMLDKEWSRRARKREGGA